MAGNGSTRRPRAARAPSTEEDVPLMPELDPGNDGPPMQLGDQAAADAPTRGVQRKLTLLLTDADQLEIDRMQPATRAKLVNGIKANAALMKEIAGDGSAAPAPAASDSLSIDGDAIKLLYGCVGQIAVAVARGFATKESAEQMKFTAEDVDLLTKPTLAVLNKYPIITGRYKEEIALGALLTVVIYGKVQQLEMIKRPKPVAAVVPFVAPDAAAPPAADAELMEDPTL